MAYAATSSSFTQRLMGAAKADRNTYEEVENDLGANSQALTVVVAAAISSGIGGAIAASMSRNAAGVAGNPVAGLIGGIVTELIGWAVWSFAIYFIGTRLFKGQATYGEVLRTTGFAYAPGLLLILRFIPALGGLIALAISLWRIWTSWVAIKAALDLDTGNTIATIVVAIIAYFVVLLVVGIVLGAIGLGTAAMLGAF